MFNLFVSASEDEWEGDPFIIELSRCVREYTVEEITHKYGDLTKSQIHEIKAFPSVFAYESSCQKDPKFGSLKEVRRKNDEVKIEYEIIKLDHFLTTETLTEMTFELEIGKWELNRTHWAIKDVDLAKELATKGIRLPQWAQRPSKTINISKHQFDVSLSFPGETRDYVESVVAEFESLLGPDKYFYDNNYKAQLARPSLDDLLQDIYRNRSKLIVVFLCEKYSEKEWCGIEFRAIKEIIMEKQHQKVMFIKMDDGMVQGVFKTDGYIDGRSHSPREIAYFIQERLSLE